MKPGHWWRAQNSCVDNAKLILLTDKAHRNWFNLNCIASDNGGVLPSFEIVAVKLRVSKARAASAVAELVAKRLFDKRDDGTFVPHDWNEWQFKTDKADSTNAERQKRYRERHRNCESNGVTTVTVKRPDTETETETDVTEANASDAGASIDHRKRLFNEGLKKLATMTGKGPDACRSFVGKCLKAASDDAITVLGLIEDAERNQAVDPCAWIAARLKGTENGKTGSRIIQAADDLRRKIASFDGPPSRDQQLRGGPGEAAARLLSNG